MNKILLLIGLCISVISCDNKAAKLQELNSQRADLKRQLDSVARLSIEHMDKTDSLSPDTANYSKQADYDIAMDVLKLKIKKVDFSIDSLSKL